MRSRACMYYIRMVFYIGQPSLCAIKKHACIHVFTHTYWYIHAAGRYRSIQADLQPGAPSPLQQRCSKFCIGRALVAFSHIACIGSAFWAFPNCKVTSASQAPRPHPLPGLSDRPSSFPPLLPLPQAPSLSPLFRPSFAADGSLRRQCARMARIRTCGASPPLLPRHRPLRRRRRSGASQVLGPSGARLSL